MKLSIITINKNNAQGLERTIQSVINQTFKDFEYIIIDGASTDSSVEIIKKYQDKIDYWVSEPDTGIYNAMNKGIKVAKGEYLLFLNSGDWLLNNTILAEVFSENFDEDIVYGNIQIGDKLIYPHKKITLRILMNSFIPHPASFIKRNLFEKIGLYDEKYKAASDWKFFLQALILENCTYKHIDKNISFFEEGGISGTELRVLENKKILQELFPRIYPDYLYYSELEEYRPVKNSRFLKFIFHLYLKLKKYDYRNYIHRHR